MAVKVKKVVLWKRDLENKPGTLAQSLKPFAEARHNLQIVMGYSYPGEHNRSALEIYPITGAKAQKAAHGAGLMAMTHTNCLLVEGDDRVGLGYELANELAATEVNISFAVIQVVGKKFLGIFGFDSADDADKATKVIKVVGATKKVVPRKKANKTKKQSVKKSGKKKR